MRLEQSFDVESWISGSSVNQIRMQKRTHVEFLDAGAPHDYLAENHNGLVASSKVDRVEDFIMQTTDKLPKEVEAATSKSDAPQARVFVGVKLMPEIARELACLAQCLERFPVRLVPPNDIHLTLVPPWNEASIPEAITKLRAVTDMFGAFTLIFQRLTYGPQPRRPRFLWVECSATDDVTLLHAALLQSFGQCDDRPFRPHVTLARIRGNGSAIARRQQIDQKLSITQEVSSIELFQSPPAGGAGYSILASLRLLDGARVAGM
jgi:2'-5' RNA ligase